LQLPLNWKDAGKFGIDCVQWSVQEPAESFLDLIETGMDILRLHLDVDNYLEATNTLFGFVIGRSVVGRFKLFHVVAHQVLTKFVDKPPAIGLSH
jgi:hypothetical protein